MTRPRRLLAALVLAALTTAGCGQDQREEPTTPGPTADAPCLITEQQLTEITGVEQTINELEIPPVDPDADPAADIDCRTQTDDRDIQISWSLSSAELIVGGPLKHEELREFVSAGGARVSEIEVGDDTPAWLGTLTVLGMTRATTATAQGREWLKVEVNGDDDTTSRKAAQQEATAVTRALVTAIAERGRQ